MGNIYMFLVNSMAPLSTRAIAVPARVSERYVLQVLRALKRRGMVDCVPSHGELIWWVEPGLLIALKRKDEAGPGLSG